jgi:hypothetical protein
MTLLMKGKMRQKLRYYSLYISGTVFNGSISFPWETGFVRIQEFTMERFSCIVLERKMGQKCFFAHDLGNRSPVAVEFTFVDSHWMTDADSMLILEEDCLLRGYCDTALTPMEV